MVEEMTVAAKVVTKVQGLWAEAKLQGGTNWVETEAKMELDCAQEEVSQHFARAVEHFSGLSRVSLTIDQDTLSMWLRLVGTCMPSSPYLSCLVLRTAVFRCGRRRHQLHAVLLEVHRVSVRVDGGDAKMRSGRSCDLRTRKLQTIL